MGTLLFRSTRVRRRLRPLTSSRAIKNKLASSSPHLKNQSPSRGTPPASSPAAPYQQGPVAPVPPQTSQSLANITKLERARVLTIAWNARRSVVHNCSLFPPPDDSCSASALRKCSIASWCAPMLRPYRVTNSDESRRARNRATHRLHRRYRYHGCTWAAAAGLHDRPLTLLPACFRSIVRNPTDSRAGNPKQGGVNIVSEVGF